MASGFEVIGLALAIFPVLVEGLKFYMEKRGRVRDFIRYRHVLKRIIRDLSREQISFRNSSHRFLEDVSTIYGLSRSDICEMMRDPQDNRWRKEIPFQGDDLKERSVAVYLETVEDMNETLKGIQDMVGMHEDAQPALLGKSTLRRQWSKIMLVIGEEDIKKHLDRARGLNVFLSQLTEQNKPRVPAGSVLQRSTLHYEQIQARAVELYEIFQMKFSTPLTCNCAPGHMVNMKLEFRSAQILKAKGLHFHTIFTFDHVEPDITPPYNWREIEMEPLGSSRLCCDQQLLHKAVTLETESSAIQTTDPNISEISNLCAVIKRPIKTGVWLGYLTDSHDHRHRVRVLALDSLPIASYTIQTISLAAILDHREFYQEFRCRLGLKLASSVMQLHATQWLANHWNKTDICFPLFSDGKIDFNNPLIKRSFGSKDETSSSASIMSELSYFGYIPCLFSLGIVLLELTERRAIETMGINKFDRMNTDGRVVELAKRLANSADCSPNYKKVIKRCIGGLDAAFESLEQKALKDEVEQKIILPLEEDLKFYCDKTYITDCV